MIRYLNMLNINSIQIYLIFLCIFATEIQRFHVAQKDSQTSQRGKDNIRSMAWKTLDGYIFLCYEKSIHIYITIKKRNDVP